MVQQPDGKLIVAGTSISPVGSVGFILLVRYLPDGRGIPRLMQVGRSQLLPGIAARPRLWSSNRMGSCWWRAQPRWEPLLTRL